MVMIIPFFRNMAATSVAAYSPCCTVAKSSEPSYVIMLIGAVFVSGVEYISEVGLIAEVVLLVIWRR
jgi:hypothetical protein